MTPSTVKVTSRPDSHKKEQVNVRLTTRARKTLSDLAIRLGISQADVLEILLREDTNELGDRIRKKTQGG